MHNGLARSTAANHIARTQWNHRKKAEVRMNWKRYLKLKKLKKRGQDYT
jgi:hypothetical protein